MEHLRHLSDKAFAAKRTYHAAVHSHHRYIHNNETSSTCTVCGQRSCDTPRPMIHCPPAIPTSPRNNAQAPSIVVPLRPSPTANCWNNMRTGHYTTYTIQKHDQCDSNNTFNGTDLGKYGTPHCGKSYYDRYPSDTNYTGTPRSGKSCSTDRGIFRPPNVRHDQTRPDHQLGQPPNTPHMCDPAMMP